MKVNALRKTPTERQFQAQVIQFARLHGWRIYHTYDSRRSAPGFPDLVLLKGPPARPRDPPESERPGEGGRVIFAELKAEGGKLTPDQEAWAQGLSAAGCEVYVWRPGNWEAIEAVLGGG